MDVGYINKGLLSISLRLQTHPVVIRGRSFIRAQIDIIQNSSQIWERFKEQLKLELSRSYQTLSVDTGDPTIFEYARAGIWIIVFSIPIVVMANLSVGTPQGYIASNEMIKAVPFWLLPALILVHGHYRIHLILSYFYFYTVSLLLWLNSLVNIDFSHDQYNYFIWLPIIASAYVAAVGIFNYFPILVSLFLSFHAVMVMALAFHFDATAYEQYPAFMLFILFSLSVFIFLFITRRTYLRLSTEIAIGVERENKLLQTQSFLEIALKETGLGLIGFNKKGAILMRAGYFPAADYQYSKYTDTTALQQFLGHLKNKSQIDFEEMQSAPVEFHLRDQHFLIGLYQGEEMTVFTSYNVTERRKWEARLRDSQKLSMIGQITSGIAHDYNNILAIAMSNMEAFPSKSEPQLFRNYIAPTIAALNHATSVSHKLLALAGRRKTSKEITDVGYELSEAQEFFVSALGTSLQFNLECEPSTFIQANSEDLKAAVLNLLINAKNALKGNQQGRVEIKVRKDEHSVYLSLRDNGPGFDPSAAKKLFEPFYTTKAAKFSTGLGLSMVSEFVKNSEGEIAARRDGGWTIFEMNFPRLKISPDILKHLEDRNFGIVERGSDMIESVLIVDDNPELLASMQRLILLRGIRCHAAGNVAEAEQLARKYSNIQFVILDYSMPDITGLKLAIQLKRLLPHSQYFILTGDVPYSLKKEAIKHGIVDVISKPVRIDVLLDRLKMALKHAS